MYKKGGFKQGTYEVVNKHKYKGKSNPTFRSSWEERVMNMLDHNVNILEWCSECVVINYYNPTDKKNHRYYTDFYLKVKSNDGSINKYIVEVKPKKETTPPKKPKNKNKKAHRRYVRESFEYVKNYQKWEAAKAYCKKYNMEFKILTEDDIFFK